MRYAYELVFPNGVKCFTTQDYRFTEEQVLNGVKKWKGYKSIKSVHFKCEVPNGYHICGCGNLTVGKENELCEECKAIYGHDYENEL